jgi:hypothetical protein
MPTELEEFHAEFLQDVYTAADADEQYLEDAFFEIFCSHLVDAGELDTADRAHYQTPRGIRVDGYGGDPISSDETLSLIILDFNQAPDLSTLTATDMQATFRRLSNFLDRSLQIDFRASLEPSAPGTQLAALIAERWLNISRVRLLLLTNRILSSRVDGRPAGEYAGVPVTYNVWDLERLFRYATSGRGREDLEIDLQSEFGGSPWTVLPAHLQGATYEAYLTVVPAPQLASIYERWGARLLEQNVRSFLQARGSVNRGIRNTIENEPEMFFAYNNGITATAEGVETLPTDKGLLVTKIRNLQIVNGGQTTASIHAASRRKSVDLAKIFVQMKLSIVSRDLAEKIVPKISEYANTQNRVNAADFFANHPFHIRMESFSRRLLAPSPDGTFRQSKWFYERARGQYQDAKAYLSPREKARFELENPKRQVFTKTDLAKFINVWRGLPHVVSRGAQKNFVDFAEYIGREWSDEGLEFNETYFRDSVARGIVFHETEQIVTEQDWYSGGYRANIVAYAIAKLAKDVEGAGFSVDFQRIWRNQGISLAMREALKVAARAANSVIIDTDRNVTEWAKQQACWNRLAGLEISWPEPFLRELITREEQGQQRRDARKDQKLLNGIEAQSAVVRAGGDFWKRVKDWGTAKGLLTPDEVSILDVAGSFERTGSAPSEKQSERTLQALKRLRDEGCPFGEDIAS